MQPVMKQLAAVALGLCLAAAQATACTLVFGQGRNASAGDEAADATWDNVNLAFNTQVAVRLTAARQAVIPIVLRVTATDLAGNVDKLLARAVLERCTRIVETTVFADYEARVLVARLREHPIVREPGHTDARPALRIGPPSYVVERQFDLTRGTLDRVRPGALADEMTAELLRR